MNDNIKAAIALLEAEGYTGITPPDYEPYRAAVDAYYKSLSPEHFAIAAIPMDGVDIEFAKGLIAAMPHMPRKELTEEFLQRHAIIIVKAWAAQLKNNAAQQALRNAINEAIT
jgi:hypothetical protein